MCLSYTPGTILFSLKENGHAVKEDGIKILSTIMNDDLCLKTMKISSNQHSIVK